MNGDFEVHPRGTGEVLRQLREAAEKADAMLNKTQDILGHYLAKHPGDDSACVSTLLGLYDTNEAYRACRDLRAALISFEVAPKAEPSDIHSCGLFCNRPECVAAREAQAQGEPEVVAWAMPRSDGLVLDVICPDEHEAHAGDYTIPLITLQSHREAMKQLLEANASYAGRERWWNDRMFELEQRLAKKDAALLACVEALKLAKTIIMFNQRPTGNVGAATIDAAITHANQVLEGGGK